MTQSDTNPNSDASRRQFLVLGLAGVGASTVGFVGTGKTQTPGPQTPTPTPAGTAPGTPTPEAGPTSIVLGARSDYWLGLTPRVIEGAENPTLRLQPGTRYELTWINLDGAKHRFIVVDSAGNELVSTPVTAEVGATRSVTLTAADQMARYRDEFHPKQAHGDVELGQGFGGNTGGQTVDVEVGPDGAYLQFVPDSVTISVGDTVRWTAKSLGHNVSTRPEAASQVQLPAQAEPFASYPAGEEWRVLEVGQTFEHTFTVPGQYVYVCVPHADQGMVGTVNVTET